MDIVSIIIFVIIGVLVVLNGIATWRHVTGDADKGWLKRARLMFTVCILLLAIVLIILINR